MSLPYRAYTGDYVLFWLDLGTHIECRTYQGLVHFEHHHPDVSVEHVPDGCSFTARSGRHWLMGKNFIIEQSKPIEV